MAHVCSRCGSIVDGTEIDCRGCGAGRRAILVRRAYRWILAIALASEALFAAAVFAGHAGERVPFVRVVHLHLVNHPELSGLFGEFLAEGRIHRGGVDTQMEAWLPEASSVLLLLLLVVGAARLFVWRGEPDLWEYTIRPVQFVGIVGFLTFFDPDARAWVMLVSFNPVVPVAILAAAVLFFADQFVLR